MSDDHVTLPDGEPDQPTEVQPPIEGDGAEQPAQSAPEPIIPVCAECSAPLDEDQPYCLECGAPTPNAPKLRRRLGPAGILAIGLAVLGIGAGILAYALANDDTATAGVATGLTTSPTTFPSVGTFPTDPSTSVDQTDPSTVTVLPPFGSTSAPSTTTSPFPSTGTFPTTTPSGTETIPPVTTEPPITTAPPVTTAPPTTTRSTTPPVSGADTWPDGTAGWTVILASTSSQSDATAFRNRVRSGGRAAGLIESSQYSTLEPDLWAVYVGVYTSRTQAINQATSLRKTYAGAYAQHIVEA